MVKSLLEVVIFTASIFTNLQNNTFIVMTKQRPTGLKILITLKIIGGVFGLFLGVFGIFLGNFAPGTENQDVSSVLIGSGLLVILFSIISLVAAYGLFQLKYWGWFLACFSAATNIIHGITSVIRGESIPASIVRIVIFGLIAYYLYRPDIKRLFKST